MRKNIGFAGVVGLWTMLLVSDAPGMDPAGTFREVADLQPLVGRRVDSPDVKARIVTVRGLLADFGDLKVIKKSERKTYMNIAADWDTTVEGVNAALRVVQILVFRYLCGNSGLGSGYEYSCLLGDIYVLARGCLDDPAQEIDTMLLWKLGRVVTWINSQWPESRCAAFCAANREWQSDTDKARRLLQETYADISDRIEGLLDIGLS
jgi:hypothetical protein